MQGSGVSARIESVLVIDDTPELVELVVQMLQSMGLRTFEASDGVAGLSLFREHRPTLVITDISMPNKDGLETIREIRAIDPEIRIVAMSGGGRAKYADPLGLARELGANETIEKPFSRAQLLAAVTRALEGRGRLG